MENADLFRNISHIRNKTHRYTDNRFRSSVVDQLACLRPLLYAANDIFDSLSHSLPESACLTFEFSADTIESNTRCVSTPRGIVRLTSNRRLSFDGLLGATPSNESGMCALPTAVSGMRRRPPSRPAAIFLRTVPLPRRRRSEGAMPDSLPAMTSPSQRCVMAARLAGRRSGRRSRRLACALRCMRCGSEDGENRGLHACA